MARDESRDADYWAAARGNPRWRALMEAADEEIGNTAKELAQQDLYFRLRRCESPIEVVIGALLFAAFDWTKYGPYDWPRVQAQAPILGGKYRADFLIEDEPEGVLIVVECDGHGHHERTREQAIRDRKRDRAMTAAGIRVLRFTGSEIHADAVACVKEVVDLYHRLAFNENHQE